MKAIYFGKPSTGFTQKIGKEIINWGTNKFSHSFPEISNQVSEFVLCRPHRSKTNKMPSSFRVHEIDVLGNAVRVYSRGDSEKALVFIHGWSGDATNFKRFYPLALALGYSVWSFDHIGHGRSQGKYANMFLFVETLKQVMSFVRARSEISGLVGHSMGASAIISANVAKDIPVVMIAPVLPFFENMYEVTGKIGISSKVLDQLFLKIEKRMGIKREDVDPQMLWANFSNDYMIFHDSQDQFIPLEKNLKVIGKTDKFSMNISEGLGHFRILRDVDIIRQALDFLVLESKKRST